MSTVSYYTEEGLKKLKDELEHLKFVERPNISQQIVRQEIKETCLKMLNTTQLKRHRECLK